ncbi:hypothetical protein, partial [Rhodococcus sp. TAF43]|uniref:hypothetical protein n=1 Tax=Rhodococcus sp. TAF43 TaxID=3237483 RepID=UPI003F977A86
VLTQDRGHAVAILIRAVEFGLEFREKYIPISPTDACTPPEPVRLPDDFVPFDAVNVRCCCVHGMSVPKSAVAQDCSSEVTLVETASHSAVPLSSKLAPAPLSE